MYPEGWNNCTLWQYHCASSFQPTRKKIFWKKICLRYSLLISQLFNWFERKAYASRHISKITLFQKSKIATTHGSVPSNDKYGLLGKDTPRIANIYFPFYKICPIFHNYSFFHLQVQSFPLFMLIIAQNMFLNTQTAC